MSKIELEKTAEYTDKRQELIIRLFDAYTDKLEILKTKSQKGLINETQFFKEVDTINKRRLMWIENELLRKEGQKPKKVMTDKQKEELRERLRALKEQKNKKEQLKAEHIKITPKEFFEKA